MRPIFFYNSKKIGPDFRFTPSPIKEANKGPPVAGHSSNYFTSKIVMLVTPHIVRSCFIQNRIQFPSLPDSIFKKHIQVSECKLAHIEMKTH